MKDSTLNTQRVEKKKRAYVAPQFVSQRLNMITFDNSLGDDECVNPFGGPC